MHRPVRSKRELELQIQKVPGYLRPKVELEQYVTDANIVAEIVWLSYMRGELETARVLDLGCGTGRFAIAATLMGARQVVCLDIDRDCVTQVRDYARELDIYSLVDIVVADAERPPFRDKSFNVVFQNPPFGIQERRRHMKREGADVRFLKTASRLGKIVYTIHKASTSDYILRKARESGCTGTVIGTRIINIPPMYRHHFKRVHKVEVVVIRAECSNQISG